MDSRTRVVFILLAAVVFGITFSLYLETSDATGAATVASLITLPIVVLYAGVAIWKWRRGGTVSGGANFGSGEGRSLTVGIKTLFAWIRDIFSKVSTRIGLFLRKLVLRFRTDAQFRKQVYAVLGVLVVSWAGVRIWIITRPVYLSPADLDSSYVLTRDVVPTDGPIIVRLPEGVEKQGARGKVVFEPAIETGWARTTSPRHIAFRLKDPLEEGETYRVSFEGKPDLSTEFTTVLRPRIESFLPTSGTTVGPYVPLVFTFNRSMVPLQGLDRTFEKDLPIEIVPETPGTFSWESERRLVFTPTARLRSSSTYSVRVGKTLTSFDGFEVAPAEYSFTVLPLALSGAPAGEISYRIPLLFTFNQPIILDEKVISVTKKGSGEVVPVDVEYASSLTYNAQLKQKERLINRSIVRIRPKKDSSGREGMFDPDTEYEYSFGPVQPREGDLEISKPITGVVKTLPLIQSIQPTSARSDVVTLDFFDPQGELVFKFSEEVSDTQTIITGTGVKTKSYGTKCAPGSVSNEQVCKKVENKTELRLTFDENVLTPGKELSVTLREIVGVDGTILGREEKTVVLKVIPPFSVSKTSPQDGEKDASIGLMTVCSNQPLVYKDDVTYHSALQTEGKIRFYYWNGSEKVTGTPGYAFDDATCETGEYETRISYSLDYATAYTMNLSFESVFGGRDTRAISFTTEKAPEETKSDAWWLSSLHRQYEVTTPERTKFTFVSENFPEVQLSICKMRPGDFIGTLGNLDITDVPPTPCLERVEQTIDLPDTKHTPHYFIVDLKESFADPRGSYVVSLTHPEHRQKVRRADGSWSEQQVYAHTLVTVSNLSVVEKKTNRVDLAKRNYYDGAGVPAVNPIAQNLYWVVDYRTLQPVSDAVISVYRNVGTNQDPLPRLDTTARTDGEGIARTSIGVDVWGATVEAGGETAVVSDWADTINYASEAYGVKRIYLYTDRPIYRPTHEVFVKGLYRIGYDASFETIAGRTTELTIRNSQGDEAFRTNITLNEFGTFNTSFTLPPDAPLGTYYIETSEGGFSYFDVEEYVPSPFRVTLDTDADEYVSGDTMEITVNAEHFFGAPIQSGNIEYAISAQEYHFDRSRDERFRFGSDWYECYDCGYGDRFVTRGEAVLDGGSARITVPLQFAEMFDVEAGRTSKIFVVRASVTDSMGKSVSGETSAIVHAASYYASVEFPSRFVAENVAAPVSIKTVDTKGYGIPRSGLSLVVERLDWDAYRRQEVDGGYYYRTTPERILVSETSVATDATGSYSGTVTFPASGHYEVTLSGTDERGNVVWSRTEQYVYGDDFAPIKPRNDQTLDIAVDDTDLAVGERSKLIIQSPYPRAKALVAIERGTVMEYDIVDVSQSYFDYDVVAKGSFSPNFIASVALIASAPEIRYGQVSFSVERDAHELVVGLTSNKRAYLPGERVTLDIVTRDHNGTPVPAEVSVAAVDMSVLALKGNPKRNPLAFFYDWFSHDVVTNANLKNIHEEIDIPTGTKGGDGGAPEDLAKKKRGTFKDTAFWSAEVRTDVLGKASVTFTLPDNLTKWQVEGIGISKDTKVGVGYLEFEEEKPIVAIPAVPRFVVPGDRFSVGVSVINQTDVPQALTVSAKSDTLGGYPASQFVVVPANTSRALYFPFIVPGSFEDRTHTVTVSAGNAVFEDVVENSIAVTLPNVFESVRLADFTDASERSEGIRTPEGVHVDQGGLTLRVNSTVAAYLEDALAYLMEFPYGCSEQLASKLGALSVIKRVASLDESGREIQLPTVEFGGVSYTYQDVINDGLKRIYASQKADGGFAYYPNLESNPGLTLHLVSTLALLREAGIEVNSTVMERAIEYISKNKKEFSLKTGIYKKSPEMLEDLLVRLYALAVVEEAPRALESFTRAARRGITKKTLDRMSGLSLAYAALASPKLGWWDRRNVWKEVEGRLRSDENGVFLGGGVRSSNADYYETGSKNTALLLRAILNENRIELPYEEIVRWLLAERQIDGAWDTTNATYEVVRTLGEYAQFKNEIKADFVLDVLLDGATIGTYTSAGQDRFSGFSTVLGFEALGLGRDATVSFRKEDQGEQDSVFYYDLALDYSLDRQVYPARDEGIQITRGFYALDDTVRARPLSEASIGDIVVGRLRWDASKPSRLFGLEDIVPAGLAVINFTLATESREVIDTDLPVPNPSAETAAFMKTEAFKALPEVEVFLDERPITRSITSVQYARPFTPDFVEIRDDRIFLFSEYAPAGSFVYEYYARVLVPGEFTHLPARAGELYNPEFFGRTESGFFTVRE